MSITTRRLLAVARLEPSRKQSLLFVNIFQSLRKTVDTSQHGSEEFDTEGAMFQEQESFGKRKREKESTDEASNSSNSDFHTEFVMRDAFGRQVGITNHMKCTET